MKIPKVILALFIATVLLSIAAAPIFCQTETLAQTKPCFKEDAYQKAGIWKQDSDELANADSSFPKAKYPEILLKAQKVVELLKRANTQPLGVQPSVSRAMSGNSYTADGALQFGIKASYMGYYCTPVIPGNTDNRGQIVAGGETETWVYINFNGLYWLINDGMSLGKSLPTADGKMIFYSPERLGEIKGFTILKPTVHTGRKEEAIIITPNDRSPYKPVTREEFLSALEKLAQKQIKERQKLLQESVEKKDSELTRIDSYSYFTVQQKAQMKEDYQKGALDLQKNLTKTIEEIGVEIVKINAFKADLSPDERQLQAVIVDRSAPLNNLFVSDTVPGSHRLVTVDKSLFNPALPRQTIQLIAVYWSWNEKDGPKSDLIRQFKQNFDFEALKQMLGK